MKLIIGIVIGFLIVFNWPKVREIFDTSLGSQSGGKVEASEPPAAISPAPVAPAQPPSLSDAVEQQLRNATIDHN